MICSITFLRVRRHLTQANPAPPVYRSWQNMPGFVGFLAALFLRAINTELLYGHLDWWGSWNFKVWPEVRYCRGEGWNTTQYVVQYKTGESNVSAYLRVSLLIPLIPTRQVVFLQIRHVVRLLSPSHSTAFILEIFLVRWVQH